MHCISLSFSLNDAFQCRRFIALRGSTQRNLPLQVSSINYVTLESKTREKGDQLRSISTQGRIGVPYIPTSFWLGLLTIATIRDLQTTNYLFNIYFFELAQHAGSAHIISIHTEFSRIIVQQVAVFVRKQALAGSGLLLSCQLSFFTPLYRKV